MTDVAKAVEAMKAKFNPSAAEGLDLVFGFRIDDTKNFSLVVKDKTCELKEGENPDAQVTLVMDSETLEGIVDGSTDGLQAFMGGKLRTEGDMLLALLRGERTKDLLRRMLDDQEFLSAFGVRALSKAFAEQPLALKMNGDTLCASYQPGESDSRLYGGNSNWRGPLWMPVNYMLIESLREFHRYYADNFSVEYPAGSGYLASLEEVADSLSERLTRLFLRDENGVRPSMAGYAQLQEDPASRDLVLFHEYFHGETGRGLGASHQTGWSALVALLLQPKP